MPSSLSKNGGSTLFVTHENHSMSLVLFVPVLAHMSRRLIGELLVYRGIRRPSVRPSVVNIFKRLLL